MKMIKLSKAALAAVVCALSMTAQAQNPNIGTFTFESPAVDSVAVEEDSVECDSVAVPEKEFVGVWEIPDMAAANEVKMSINLYTRKSRNTIQDGEEATISCYGVIFLGNAEGYTPDYCTILAAQINGNRASITFQSSRDSNTYSADLVSSEGGYTITVENIKLRKVVWSPNPQTMLKNGMTFNYTGDE